MTATPWMKWFPSDWRADPKLRACEPITRYVWMEMLGLMHEADPYGHLVINGKPIAPEVLARLIGVPLKTVKVALKELDDNAVFSVTDDGVIFSRRMVRDELRATSSRVRGQKGGNPALKKQVVTGRRDNLEDNREVYPRSQKPEARGQIPEEDKGSEAIASGASAPSIDPKTILFRQGLPLLAQLTGRPEVALRPILGRWLKLTGDDCGAVLAEIERCRGSPRADPVAWIEARLKPKAPHERPRSAHDKAFAALAAYVGEAEDANQSRRERGDSPCRDGDHDGPAARAMGARRFSAAVVGGRG